MAQISNSTSLVAVKVFPKKEFSLTGEVRTSPNPHKPYPTRFYPPYALCVKARITETPSTVNMMKRTDVRTRN